MITNFYHVNFTSMHSNGKLNYKRIIKVDKKIAITIMDLSYKILGIVYLSGLIATIYFKNDYEKLSKGLLL